VREDLRDHPPLQDGGDDVDHWFVSQRLDRTLFESKRAHASSTLDFRFDAA
jgi:hypothetical protein